jgi:hypothetical protein
MYTYTMTFVSPEPIVDTGVITHSPDASLLVAEKISQRDLELADFNWTTEYSFDNSLSYLQKPYTINFVVEVRVKLDMLTILDKEAIYKRCFEALMKHEVMLTKSHCIENMNADKPKCILCFDMKTAA